MDDSFTPADSRYLFVSYARSDSDIVMRDLAILKASRVNYWCDREVTGGAPWREELARRIKDSAAVVCFMSLRSIESRYCTQEISFAIDEDKPLICVHLEALVLPPGLRMTIGDRQALLRYEFAHSDYGDRLLAAAERALNPVPATTTFLPNTAILPDSLLLSYAGESFVVPFAFSGIYEIGRSGRCQLNIDSSFISRRHGHFRWARGVFRYCDHSVNGTILETPEGEQLVRREEVALPSSGALKIGDCIIRFEVVSR
jgi:hypothetical protein